MTDFLPSLRHFLSLLTIAALAAVQGCAPQGPANISSPDGQVQLTFSLQKGVPVYEASYKGVSFLRPSRLGLDFMDQPALDSAFTITSIRVDRRDTTWASPYGTADSVRNRYRQLTVELRELADPGRTLQLQFRTYDEGLAFRYIVPEQPDLDNLTVREELSTFRFASDYTGFAMRRSGFGDNYEGFYRPRRLSQIAPDSLTAMPLTLELRNGWAALTEAALTGYAGMSLTGSPDRPATLRAALAPLPGEESGGAKARVSAPFRTPWRTVLLADRAGELATSHLVQNLNEPSRIADTSWIRPGQIIWPWWNGRIAGDLPLSGEPGTSVMKYYIDFAAEHDISALLVDAGWYSLEGEAWRSPEEQNLLTMEETRAGHYDVQEVIRYGSEKDVDVHLWVHLNSLAGQAEDILSTWAQWGAAGIKVDSYGGDHQELVDDLQEIVRIAARHELMVNYHGAYKPTGWERTWPNFMTREGVFGLEQSKGSPRPDATHNVILPYTRMVAGAMDYTPGAFDLDGTPEHPKHVQTTLAHQVAMYVVYYSPQQMLVDYPDAYRSRPGPFRIVRNIPATWSESRFLDGRPGEYVVMARRSGHTWHLGAMTGNEGRTVQVPLDFLEEDVSYRARSLMDGSDADADPSSVTMADGRYSSRDTLSLVLAGSGGAAIRFWPSSGDR
ncbi:MAG: glycoside hydrolase family 97 protein [Balneolaceae bacterium]|nr:glycoside hydrolase family 97 protein [Balneolaceae bacterium]